MKNHMISHTYTYENSEFKCDVCAFDWTMQIHHGKMHNKKTECGLCEYDATENKNVDIHLKTCEIYECKECGHVTKENSKLRSTLEETLVNVVQATFFTLRLTGTMTMKLILKNTIKLIFFRNPNLQ